jgi:hypothetical protein
MMKKFLVEFEAADVECKLEVEANGYEDVKERFLEKLRARETNGLLIGTHDRDESQAAQDFMNDGRIKNHHIKRTKRLED